MIPSIAGLAPKPPSLRGRLARSFLAMFPLTPQGGSGIFSACAPVGLRRGCRPTQTLSGRPASIRVSRIKPLSTLAVARSGQRRCGGVVCLQITLAIAGCLSVGCVQMHPTRSGFLSDYSRLRSIESDWRCVGKGDARLVRSSTCDTAAGIDSFFIAPVEWLADDMGQPASSLAKAEAVRCALQQSLAKELGAVRPIVASPGPRTATVRSAVTAVQESKPIVNALMFIQTGPLFNGGAAMEIEIVDPQGIQIAAESAAIMGRDWDLIGFFCRERHAEKAAQRAAAHVASHVQAMP